MITTPSEFVSEKYDFLIVGGGTAGLVVAARLSEDPSIKVGVIEAGEHVTDMPEINVPGLIGKGLNKDRIDWKFKTVPQPEANGRSVFQPRGKVLGGSSALNFMVSGRGPASEYDAIAKLGNPGWNWSEFLKYFKKSESFTRPDEAYSGRFQLQFDPNVHGTDGPVKLTYPGYIFDQQEPFVSSLINLGVKNNPEPTNGHNVGSTLSPATVDPVSLTRSYSATAYYEPNANRKNFAIVTQAQVTKILLDKSQEGGAGGVTASGVEFVHGGQKYVAKASQEVILSAGSLQTPQLLELSGIGSKDILSKFGIETIVDLPSVGENLQDHLFIPCSFEIDKKHVTLDHLNLDPAEHAKALELFYTQKKGIYSAGHGPYSFLPLRNFASPEEVEELKKRVAQDISYESSPGLRKQFQLFKEWFDSPENAQAEIFQSPGMMPGTGTPAPGAAYQTIVACNMHPFSRGSVHIQSADPLQPPAIDPAYFRNPIDLDVIVKAVKFARKVANTPPLGDSLVKMVQPGPEVQTDEQFAEYCKNKLWPVFHPLGSAAMLPKEDGGVVSPQLVVYGTKNLRVVDASILPFELSCHICLTVYALAEKASDIIKESLLRK